MRRALLVAMVGMLLSAVPAAAGTGSGWQITPAVVPGALNGLLFGESCVSARACTVVGATSTARGLVVPLAERWNGRGWRIERPPLPGGAHLAQLYSVWCSSAGSCVAVGRYVTGSGVSRVLVERRSGSRWRVVRSVDPAGSPQSELNSVSCIGLSSCIAVGDTLTSSGAHRAFSERWNGRAWHLVLTPNLAGAANAFLSSVACVGSDSCVAVGWSDSTALAERWDGARWHLAAAPSPAGAQYAFLSGVSCASRVSCTAVGGWDGGNLAERWNGAVWHAEALPGPRGSQFSYLNGVSCATAGVCSAVGGYINAAGLFVTQGAERTSGGWSSDVTPNPAHTSGNLLWAVACVAVRNCLAVGQANGDGTPSVLGARWDGRWTRMRTPTPHGAAETQLNGVACPNAKDCIAVGTSGPTAGRKTAVAQRWDGHAWHPQTIPSPPGADPQGIDCTAQTFCMAVGGEAAGTLAERWNGARWVLLATPTPGGSHDAGLGGVSCTSESFCMAAGGYCTATKAICDTGNGPNSALTERWNGLHWTAIRTPEVRGAVQTFIGGISCTSPMACTTVGETHLRSGAVRTLAERWNGDRWRIQSTQDPAGVSSAGLGGVACTSRFRCIAVGPSDAGNISELWDGTAWRMLPTPTPDGSQGLTSISCAAARACTAAGFRFTVQGGYVVAERWNGAHWTIQPTPLFAGDVDMNATVTCPTTVMCMAVGGQESPNPTAIPYAEQWTAGRETGVLADRTSALGASAGVSPGLLRMGEVGGPMWPGAAGFPQAPGWSPPFR